MTLLPGTHIIFPKKNANWLTTLCSHMPPIPRPRSGQVDECEAGTETLKRSCDDLEKAMVPAKKAKPAAAKTAKGEKGS